VLFKPPPPILLSLTTQSRKPATKGDLLEKTQKNREPHHLKPPVIELRSQRMDGSTVRTTVSLQQQCLVKPVKKPAYIAMAPQSRTPAPRTPRRTGPRIVLEPITQLFQELDIEIAIQYQVRRLWGITEGTTPARECTLGYPFSFPSTYSEKKKNLYNIR
jgi:hypothetical protein